MKTDNILSLYDRLVRGMEIVRKDFCREFSISERTFYRYLNEIFAFLRAHRPDCVVDVYEPHGRYYLKTGQH